MRGKRAKAAKMLHDACIYLYNYGHKDAAVNVACQLIMDAERRVLNGFGPVPVRDADHMLEVERKYLVVAEQVDPYGLLIIGAVPMLEGQKRLAADPLISAIKRGDYAAAVQMTAVKNVERKGN